MLQAINNLQQLVSTDLLFVISLKLCVCVLGSYCMNTVLRYLSFCRLTRKFMLQSVSQNSFHVSKHFVLDIKYVIYVTLQ